MEETNTNFTASSSNKSIILKRILPITVGVVILLTGIVGGYFFWLNNYAPIATIDGHKITREDVQNDVSKYRKVYAYNKDNESLNNINKVIADALIEKTIVQSEAAKRGITVSDKEVDKKYNEYLSLYKDQAEMTLAISTAYGWSDTDIRTSISDGLLKDKLSDAVVAKKDVSFIYYRYDFNGEEGLKLAEPAIALTQQNIKKGATLESEARRVQSEGLENWRMPNFGVSSQKDLNSTIARITFAGPEDWPAVSKLSKVGEYTDIVKSSGGYFAIYRLDFINDGEFNSWPAFMDNYKKSSKFSVASSLPEKMLSSVTRNVFAAGCVAGLQLVDGKCKPSTATQNQSHFAYIFGYVNTMGGVVGPTRSNDAELTATLNEDPALAPPLNADGVERTYTGKSKNDTLMGDGDGYYTLGYASAAIGIGTGGTSHGLMPCYWTWDVVAAKTGYKSEKKLAVFVNGQALRMDFTLLPGVAACACDAAEVAEKCAGEKFPSTTVSSDCPADACSGTKSCTATDLYCRDFVAKSTANPSSPVVANNEQVTFTYKTNLAYKQSIEPGVGDVENASGDIHGLAPFTPANVVTATPAAIEHPNVTANIVSMKATQLANTSIKIELDYTDKTTGSTPAYAHSLQRCKLPITSDPNNCVPLMDDKLDDTDPTLTWNPKVFTDTAPVTPGTAAEDLTLNTGYEYVFDIYSRAGYDAPESNNFTSVSLQITPRANTTVLPATTPQAYPPKTIVTYGGETVKKYTMTVTGASGSTTCSTKVSKVCTGTNCPPAVCKVTASINPSKIIGDGSTPSVPTIAYSVSNVAAGGKATVEFDGVSEPIIPINGDFVSASGATHSFTGGGFHGMTVSCYDKATDTKPQAVAKATLLVQPEAKPCPGLCSTGAVSNITKTIFSTPNATATLLANGDFETIRNNYNVQTEDVKLNFAVSKSADIATIFSVPGNAIKWNYLGREGDAPDPLDNRKATATDLAFLKKIPAAPPVLNETLGTPWTDPIGSPLIFTRADKKNFGKYNLSLEGWTEPKVAPAVANGNRYLCNVVSPSPAVASTDINDYSCPITVNIVHKKCTVWVDAQHPGVKDIVTSPTAPNNVYTASNSSILPITFSTITKDAGITPDGFQAWQLDKIDSTGKATLVSADSLSIGELPPSIAYNFGGTYLANADKTKTRFGSGTYKLTFKASSMIDGFGNYDPAGGCDKAINFIVNPGAEMSCQISPVTDISSNSQQITLKMSASAVTYTGEIKLSYVDANGTVTKKTTLPSGTMTKTADGPWKNDAYVGPTLNGGSYYIAIEATKISSADTTPNVIPCNAPLNSISYCPPTSTTLCNYVVPVSSSLNGGAH